MNIQHCAACGSHYTTQNACPDCEASQSQKEARGAFLGMVKDRRPCIDGMRFDSKAEAQRYLVLKEQAQNGLIANLEAVKSKLRYTLQPAVILPANALRKASKQRAIAYTPDFRYAIDGVVIVEDVKGSYGSSKGNRKRGRVGKPIITDAARLRHKLLQAQHPHIVFKIVCDHEITICFAEIKGET